MTSRTRIGSAAAIGASALMAGPAVMASTYVVRPGDTLTDIAVRHGTTVSALAHANHISNPSLLRVGQLLEIPDNALGLPAYTAGAQDIENHTVVAGESIFSVARSYGVDLTALARVNSIRVNAQLHPGAVLHIPGRLARANALLTHTAQEHGVDPKLIRAVAWMESGWQQGVTSSTGAVGMMQIEPYTGEWVSKYIAGRHLNLHAAGDNVLAGTLLLKHLLAVHHGDVNAALAAYYQGDASISSHGLYGDTKQYQRVVGSLLRQS
jgi:soluble lytic murein transglycosylase-like protein